MAVASREILEGCDRGRRPVALEAVGAAGGLALLVLAAWPGSMFPSWTPRMAALLIVGIPGVVLLLRQTLAGDLVAGAAWAVVAWVGLSAVISGSPRSSVLGFVGRDLSWLVVLLSFGCWAVGRALRADRTVVTCAFVWSAAAVGLIGVVQVVLAVDGGYLALQAGRPASLLVNPVYFGAVCASGCVAAVGLAGLSRLDIVGGTCIIVLGAGVSVSGSRAALAAVVAVVAALVAMHRHRSFLVAAGLGGAGLLGGFVLDVTVGSGTNATSRLAGANSDGRLSVWRHGLEAWTDRSIVGHGIGRFRSAVQGRYDADFVAQYMQDDRTPVWFDPHNVIILVLVGTGVVGLGLVSVWLVLATRWSSGPQMWAAAALAATWLLQPVSIHTLPLTLLLFGAAYTPSVDREADVREDQAERSHAASSSERACDRSHRGPWLATMGVGVLAGAWVLAADFRLDQAADRLSPSAAASAAAWYWRDPIVADVVAQIYEIRGDLDRSLEWREKSVDFEPDRPYWWTSLARAKLLVHDEAGARAAIERALDLQPTNHRALIFRDLVDERHDDGP